MNRTESLLVAMTTLLAVACGSSKNDTSEEPSPTEPPLGISETAIQLETPEFDVPPGDHFMCVYTDIVTDRDLYVHSSSGRQAKGGHHIGLFHTNTRKKTPGMFPCTADGNGEMIFWRPAASGAEVGGTGADDPSQLSLPEGMAFKIPAGSQLVLQAHYINASGKPLLKVRDRVTAALMKPSEVRESVGMHVANDASFRVRASGTTVSSSVCTVTEDLSAIRMFGHMHELGSHFKLERIDEKDQPIETLLDHDWEPLFVSHAKSIAFPADAPYQLKKGMRFRHTCTWKNAGMTESTFPNEMCVAMMFVFPDRGLVNCEAVPVAPQATP